MRKLRQIRLKNEILKITSKLCKTFHIGLSATTFSIIITNELYENFVTFKRPPLAVFILEEAKDFLTTLTSVSDKV